jgi:serine/threonine protein kinase
MPSLQNTRKRKSIRLSPRITHRSLQQRLRRSIRKAKSAEPYSDINAQKIGEGGFGIVSRPPARCAHFFSKQSKNINLANVNSVVFQETYYKNPNYISKLSEYDAASKELGVGNIIKDSIKNWRDYYCFVEFICEAPKDKHIQVGVDEFQDTYGIAPYCGVTLNEILKRKYHMSVKEICCLMEALKGLCIGLGQLHSIEIYHKDIHDGNILFNPKDGKLRWIDFGLAEDLYDKKKVDPNSWEYNPMSIRAKLEDTESLILHIIKPTLEFIRYMTKKSKETTTKRCYDDATYYLHKMPKKVQNYILPSKNRSKNEYYKALNKIKNKYIDYIEDFIEGYDETKKCEWMTKN